MPARSSRNVLAARGGAHVVIGPRRSRAEVRAPAIVRPPRHSREARHDVFPRQPSPKAELNTVFDG
ncbi:hypothetical protein FKP32DRAFT_1676016 [Trametes sanguinea]|nr:hypothetical protein FKP32DRAFT_1676016 [Trametes sanguinea]